MSMSKPAARRAARSAMVDLEPGRRMRWASPGRGRAGPDAEELDLRVGGEGVEVVEVGDAGEDGDGDADGGRRWGRRGRGRGRPRRGGGGRRRRRGRGRCGRQPVRSAMVAMPSAKRVGSPRKRLTMKPFISAASAGSRTACVPTRLAMTPPRSMSPMRTTGASAARAKPMLAMSLARRLISEALPAPSTRTRSASAERRGEAVEDVGQEGGLEGLVGAGVGGGVDAALDDDLGAGLALRA